MSVCLRGVAVVVAWLFELARWTAELATSSLCSDPPGSRPGVVADAGVVGGVGSCVFFGILGMGVS